MGQRKHHTPELFTAALELFDKCPKLRKPSGWISNELEKKGFVNAQGLNYSDSAVNSILSRARKAAQND